MPEEIPISPLAQAGTIHKVGLKDTEFKTNSVKKLKKNMHKKKCWKCKHFSKIIIKFKHNNNNHHHF